MHTIIYYRDLLAWQVSMDVVTEIYNLTKQFPPEERFGLVSQMQRAAVSIPSNIAEGHSRNSSSEFIHFLNIAQGSLSELKTQIEISVRVGLTRRENVEILWQLCEKTGRLIFSLRKSIIKKNNGDSDAK